MSLARSKRSHIDFVVNQKKLGKTLSEIVIAFEKKFGIKKSPASIDSMYTRYKHEYDLKGLKTNVQVKAEVAQAKLLKIFLSIVKQRNYIPIQAEFLQAADISHGTVSTYFGSFEGMIKRAKEEYPDVFENIIDESSFNDENFIRLRDYIAKHKRILITTAVTGCEPHMGALKSINTYCKSEKAGFLILPCSDPAKTSEKKNKWSLSHKLPKENVVFRNVSLNNNLFISTIKMSAKQILPLTGLKGIGQKTGASVIFASPKQFLEFVSLSNNNSEVPRALMTTGAVTKSDYHTETYMGDRTAVLADEHHELGGIIVEIKDQDTFFFRQVHFEKSSGAFCDLNKKYYPDGRVEQIEAELIALGDYHCGFTDPNAKRMAKELCYLLKPKWLTVEDFHDGFVVNPHDEDNIVAQSIKAKKNLISLENEFLINRDELDELSTWPVGQIVCKYGNHEDFLRRWISKERFVKDKINKLLGMELTLAFEKKGIMPFEYAMRHLYPIKNQDKVRFLGPSDSFRVNGIENGAHGHLGKSGKRNPGLPEISDCYGASNTGHTHTAAKWRNAYRQGTSSLMQLSYNEGPGAWTHTHTVQHYNGSRQLIHSIYGEWKLK